MSDDSNFGVSSDISVIACTDKVVVVTPGVDSDAPGVSELNTLQALTSIFKVYDSPFEYEGATLQPGVWFFGDSSSNNKPPCWICSPITIEAITSDSQSNNFGRLIRFRNSLMEWREWSMPMEMLRSSADELRGELLSMGVEIGTDTKARSLLVKYLQSVIPQRKLRCALQVGWFERSFVLPDQVIGLNADKVTFQSETRSLDEYTKSGDIDGWKLNISNLAIDNPMLTLAISSAFTGPLLELCNCDGGGVHFIGDSSTGKTTLLAAACSVWGGENYRRSWRATSNGMEGAAVLFNDCLLALDEISECDPQEVGAIVYSLSNGRGKQRAGRTGKARSVSRWRCFIVSTGERSVETSMLEGNRHAKAGQTVRMLDVPAARTYGVWDNLHNFKSGAELSDAIQQASAIQYGFVGRAFLEKLTREGRNLTEILNAIKSRDEFEQSGQEGQHKRVAARFALIALAGELATEYGLTNWTKGDAIKAASIGYAQWKTLRRAGNDEQHQIIEKLRSFIERHGDGRFSDCNFDHSIRNRAGWWRNDGVVREYLFNKDGIREALKGFDFNLALNILQLNSVLPKSGVDGKRSQTFRINGRSVRLYVISYDKLIQ